MVSYLDPTVEDWSYDLGLPKKELELPQPYHTDAKALGRDRHMFLIVDQVVDI